MGTKKKWPAYVRMLDAAVLTVNAFTPNPFMPEKPRLSLDEQVEYIWARMKRLKTARGYSPEYIKQLLMERPR